MHYYNHNIADYRKDTAHLSLLEHGIYRQLVDTYYLDEKPIETKSVIRRLSIRTEEEKTALENVFSDFFAPSECGNFHYHKRCDDEIEKYQAKKETAKANGSKGGRPKKPKKTQSVNSANPEKTGPKANQEPITNNHKPILNTDTNVSVETDVSTESPSDKISKPKKSELIPYVQIVDLYREILCPALPDITKLSPARQAQVRARHQDIETLDGGRSYFELVQSAPHLMGKTPPTPDRPQSWKADFDWLIKEANFLKVIEGKYHGN